VVRVPRVLEHGADFVLLESLELRRDGDWGELGRLLARLHRETGSRFGWHRDNHIGRSPQANGWMDDWNEFWWTRRLEPQLRRAGLDANFLRNALRDHRPVPSLLHGDLWSGNAGFTDEGPVLFDPAVYYGDREADLAMTELFGGFAPGFYAAYERELPLDEGYAWRKHLYNLYHLLNHLNLFGGGYRAQVEATLGLLRRRLE
jgi:fructosamine-3-kinase